ncbi:unannotated protein [freshwater metagenome]|uniref:Unannotated protein n=1 Tax=freshwater metagenome TaxID=449393 RepID=A0A6J6LXS1_9ZZZZ|nr:hypothetical protein [Actinomycetota bacterium]
MSDLNPAPALTPEEKKSKRRKDLWQLDIPLVLGLLLCGSLSVIEFQRAFDGIGRAWVYAFQWPLIGAVCCWIWYRYRTEGNVTKGFTNKWKQRVAALEAQAQAAELHNEEVKAAIEPTDPELLEWKKYVDDLQRREPPGQPPQAQ